MSNGYLLADTNSLIYAYRAGGPQLLDTYLETAEQQDRRFAITATVRQEIYDGPLRAELGQTRLMPQLLQTYPNRSALLRRAKP